jgi:nucleoside 2-deoxyribosyltransferase
MASKEHKNPPQEEHHPKSIPRCGIIMPISDTPDLGYPIGHWSQVLDIVINAASNAGFRADMVSNDAQVDIIHATIIKNIYANDVAVCDVSTRNPNVMFELGLRIASKKPVILIKDETTPFSFDTQLIPHLPYRRDLRMHETLAFQKQLSEKIKQAHEDSQQQGYKSFLEQFTSYTLAQVDEQQVGAPEYLTRISDKMQGLEDAVKFISSRLTIPAQSQSPPPIPSLPRLPSIAQVSRPAYVNSYDLISWFLKTANVSDPSDLTSVQKARLIGDLGKSEFLDVKGKNAADIQKVIDDYNDLPF